MTNYIWVAIPNIQERIYICREGYIKYDGEVLKDLSTFKFDWISGNIDYDIGYISVVTFQVYNFPLYVLEQIEVIYKDKDTTNKHIDNLRYKFKNGPIPHEYMKGLYHIPYYSKYLIKENGNLWNIRARTYNMYYDASDPSNVKNVTGGYKRIRATRDYKNNRMVGRHVLLCLAFKEYHTDPFKLVVNHDDGVPGNDGLLNLDWSTYSENLIHALRNGLMPNSTVKIEVFNWITNKYYKFNSMAEGERFFNIKKGKLYRKLTRGQLRYADGLVCKTEKDKWTELPNMIYFTSNSSPYIVTIDNDVMLFKDALSCSSYLQVPMYKVIRTKIEITELNGHMVESYNQCTCMKYNLSNIVLS